MKTPNPSHQKTINLLLFYCILTGFAACEKDKPQQPEPVKSLIGNWYTPTRPGEQGISIYFFADSTVATRKPAFGNTQTTDTVYTGKFRTLGDSLKISITERTIYKADATLSKEPSNVKFFQNATYNINGSNLILNYNDIDGAPSRITFLRLLPLM